MSRRQRVHLDDVPLHIVQRGHNREPCFFGDENLVKTDAFVYSSDLDYVVDAHAMPFVDNSFDYIYSLAVFEHLHSPWVAAKEIFRVLKPGGKVYVLTAFMQHVHGYPHHFFNMTHMGVERIFSDFEVIRSGPGPHCPMEQLAVILCDLSTMAMNLTGNKSAEALSKSIDDFCRALPDVQTELIKLARFQLRSLAANRPGRRNRRHEAA